MFGIRIYRLHGKATHSEIKKYFANPKNGGGPIKVIYFPLTNNDAVVVFEDQDTADTVMMHEDHMLLGQPIDVNLLPPVQVFTSLEARLEPSVATFIEASTEVKDEIKFGGNVEYLYDSLSNTAVVKGNWFEIECVSHYINTIMNRQRRLQHRISSNHAGNVGATCTREPPISSPSTDKGSRHSQEGSHDAEVLKMSAKKKEGIKDLSFGKENNQRIVANLETKIINDDPEDLCSLEFFHKGLKVSIYTGDITLAETDVIVNAANERLFHVGGVAYAIASKASERMGKQCDDYIKKHGDLPTSAVMHTSAGGKLSKKVKYIIHAVGPYVYLTTTDEEFVRIAQQLTSTFLNCFKHGESLKVKSMALPAISTGVFGCPLEMCVSSFFNAILLFTNTREKKHACLQEVHLVSHESDNNAITVLQLRHLLAEDLNKMATMTQQKMESLSLQDQAPRKSQGSQLKQETPAPDHSRSMRSTASWGSEPHDSKKDSSLRASKGHTTSTAGRPLPPAPDP